MSSERRHEAPAITPTARRRRALGFRLFALTLLILFVANCSAEREAESEAAGLPSELALFDEAYDHYLNDPYPPFPAEINAATRPQAAEFYDEGDRRLAALQTAWELLDRATLDEVVAIEIAPGTDLSISEFVALIEPWMVAQAEQAAASRTCALDDPDPPACFAQMFEDNGERWLAAADAVNEVLFGRDD